MNTLPTLIARFRDNIAQYKSGTYDEAKARVDFIDKFFELLGWDVRNVQGHAEQYREVVREDRVVINEHQKAPDYAFRIGSQRKFFVEAKKPSVNIRDEVAPAFQVRRYGYSAGLPLSILTDFEEFAVYDTRIRPHKDDKASKARIFYCRYDEYLGPCSFEGFATNFDFITATFSKDAILRGSFDRYIEANRNKRGTGEVDRDLLATIEAWRLTLAQQLAKHNPALDALHLNIAVQRIIDRVLFLRIAEDRSIEQYGELLAAVKRGNIYTELLELFHRADGRYNAGLFRHEVWLDEIAVPDKPLADIIRGLYYPESPYAFSVLPIEILGSIYERFLGSTITLTAAHKARVEQKPEVRKAGGVFYTPQYIVDYIIKETVGRKLDAKLPPNQQEKSKIRPTALRKLAKSFTLSILDPACGSGSFLVGAYQFLLDWYLAFYSQDGYRQAALQAGILRESGLNTWALSLEEKQRILLDNLYGVDIDGIAVEVTKLSLYLKLLENEIPTAQHVLLHQKLLPNLDANIRSGNSLVASDFYADKQLTLFADTDLRRVNAFDWAEAFTQAMDNGGFDCVIGNPPYVRQETLDADTKTYFQQRYAVYQGTADLYAYFIERGIGLLRPGGIYGIIVANKWLRANYGLPLRKWLKTQTLLEIIDFGDLPVFGKVTAYPMILRVTKPDGCQTGGGGQDMRLAVSQVATLDFESLEEHIAPRRRFIDPATLDDGGWQLGGQEEKTLFDRLMTVGTPLKEYVGGRVYYGIKTGLNDAFVIDRATRDRLIAEDPASAEVIRPFLAGRDIKRYAPLAADKFLILFPKGFTNERGNRPRGAWRWLTENYPAIAAHLEPFAKRGKARCDQGDYWWELRACDYYEDFEKPKIMFPDIALRMQATLDLEANSCANTAYIIPVEDKFFLAILNSNVTQFVYTNLSPSIRGGYLRFIRQYIEHIPIPTLDPTNKTHNQLRDRLIALVDQTLEAHARLPECISEYSRRTVEQRALLLDREMNTIIYKLYGLSEEEIKIIESN